MRLRSRLPLLLLVCLACTPSSREAHGKSAPPNVILICLDTVRGDHMGFNGYTRRATTPSLDALAARSVVYADASASSGWTKPSVPSFLTGTPPAIHGVYEGSARGAAGVTSDVLPEAAVTLAEVFRDAGFRTGAFVQNAQLRRGMGFEQGFETFVDGAGRADEIRVAGLDWLDQQATDAPFFLYLHFLDAHWPYPVPDEYALRWARAEEIAPYRDGDSRALRDAINHGEVPFGAEEREALLALYDGSIRYLDDQLGELLRDLDARGLTGDTVIALVSDHGEEFGENGRIGHGHGLSEGLLRVPFLIHVPGDAGLAGLTIETPVSLLDLFPTLLHAAGVADPGTSVGLDRLAHPELAVPIVSEHKAPDRYLQALRQDSEKLLRIWRPTESHPGSRFELGARLEAELRLEEGRWVATQVKPREEDPGDAPELKGPLHSLVLGPAGELAFRIGELGVVLPANADRTLTEGVADHALAEGRWVKVRGPIRDGTLTAERIKIYSPLQDSDLELRATLTGLDPAAATLRFGEVEVWLSADTRYKELEMGPETHAMDRRQVLAAASGQTGGLSRSVQLLDLAEVTEPAVANAEQRIQSLGQSLDQLLESWAARQLGEPAGGRLLSDEELGDLAAIGYLSE